MPGVDQFDHVRITSTPETERLGYAGRIGVCYGFTTPSVTGVEVVGGAIEDFAFAVDFEVDGTVWFAADLVEFVDHNPGVTMTIGDKSFVRAEDGTWHETG